MAAGDEDLELDAVLNVDEAAAQREFARLGSIIERSMEKAFANASKTFTTELNKALRGAGTEAVTRGLKNMGEAAEASTADFKRLQTQTRSFDDDIESLRRQTEAMQNTLQRGGADPKLFSIIEAELHKVLKLQNEFNNDIEAISRNPNLLKGYEVAFEGARSTIFRQVSLINETLRTLSTTQDREGQRANLILRDQLREREQLAERARSEFVITNQREGAQLLAETRLAGQRRLQQERQFGRTRIEILRFTLQQIRTLERAIGTVFRGAASIVTSSVARIEGVAQRMGQVFGRSNRELNDGLQPALLSRERTISRSFDRQQAIVTNSLIQQSRTLERFERQAATGVTGVVTGRSGLGALLGGGVAIGGGFLLLDKLRAGFEESVNLNESLNKTRQIFGDASADIEEFASNSVEALFSTGSEALSAAASFGIFGRAAGLTGQPLADFSKKLTVLATDLASFNNTDVDQAVVALSAALRGEQEPIRVYGILLDDATLRQRAFADNITETVRKLTPAERVLAAYNEILAQTAVQQGDAARTADDFANSSRRAAAATTETFAAISSAFVPLATFLTNFTFVVMPRLTAFIEGNVGPALEILRDGLIGAGAALAGLLAARAAGEALQFLALALRAVLTPMGLFIAGVAAIGAAINILKDRSPEFASAIRTVSGVIEDVLGRAVDLGRQGLEFLGDIIDDHVIPALERFMRFVGTALRTALEFGIGFVITVVIPGLRAFARLITETVLPALEKFGSALLDRIVPALRFLRDGASEALQAIMPYLEPAIDGFLRLGDAIIGAATSAAAGDFSGVIDGLRTFIEGISPAEIASAVGLGAIGAAIGGPLGAAIGVAAGLGLGGSLQDLGGVAIRALTPQLERVGDFVEGFFTEDRLSGIATSFLGVVRRVGEVIGSIVTDPRFILALELIAAAAVATGGAFLVGFVQGVGDNVGPLARQLGGHLKLLVTEAVRFAVSDPLTIATIFVGVFAARAFLGRIRAASAGVGAEAATGFASGLVRATRQSFQGNEFAGAFFGGIDKAFRRSEDQLLKTEARYANRLKLLGQTVDPSESFKKQFDDLVTKYGQASVAGASFRESTKRIFADIRTAGVGVGQVFTEGVGAGLRTAGGAVRSFGTNVKDLFRNTIADMRAGGFQLGSALGGSIVAGVGAALSGQALGTSDSRFGQGIGLAGIISSALLGAASVGGGPQGVLVGGLIASLGLVSAAFARSGKAAEEASRLVDTYTDILLRHQTVAEAIPDIADQITAAFRDESEEVQGLLLETEITAEQFAKIFSSGAVSTADALSLIGRSLDIPIDQLRPFADTLDNLGDALRSDAALSGTQFEAFRTAMQRAGIDADDLIKLIEVITRESGAMQGALSEADFDRAFNPEPVEASAEAQNGLATAVERTADAIGRGLGRGRIIIDDLGVAAVETGRKFLEEVAEPVDFVGQALQSLNEQRLQGINDRIATVTEQLGTAREAADLAKQALSDYLTGQFQTDASGAIDEIILGLPDLQSGIAKAVELGLDQGSISGQAQFDTIFGGLQRQISAALQAALAEDPNFTVSDARNALSPIQQAAEELFAAGVIDARTRDTIINQIQGVIDDPTVASLLEEIGVIQLDKEQLEADLKALNAELEVNVAFSATQVDAELRRLFPDLTILVDPDSVAGRQVGAPALNPTGPTNPIAQAEVRADAELRSALANMIAQESVRRTGDAAQRQIVVEGDLVAQKVDSQTFQSADSAERTASAAAQALRLASGTAFNQVLSGIS